MVSKVSDTSKKLHPGVIQKISTTGQGALNAELQSDKTAFLKVCRGRMAGVPPMRSFILAGPAGSCADATPRDSAALPA